MRIAAIGSAFPGHYYSQADILPALKRTWAAHPGVVRRADQIYANTGVDGRHFVLPLDVYEKPRTFGENNDAWIGAATTLGEAALRNALQLAGIGAGDVDTLLFTTVTGLATPSIDARLVHRMGLSPRIKRMPLFGLGCVAGAAGLARAADQVATRPQGIVALLSVELCSLTLQLDDVSMANLIATALFGDGAMAVIVTGEGHRSARRGPRVVATRSVLYPDTERAMGWDVSSRGFHLVLSPDVPDVVSRHVRGDVDSFLADHGLSRREIARWILHPGGPKILDAITTSLELSPDDVASTWSSLRRVGNLSSSSVLHVLKDTVEEAPPPPGSFGLMLAMGPGFCSELLLLEWDEQ